MTHRFAPRTLIDTVSPKSTRTALAATILAMIGFASGCSKQAPAIEAPPAPTVDGERVSFPENAPQLASLSSETAELRTLALVHLTGRLYWNDDSTVRIFSPVMGRVTSVRADIGKAVSAGDPLAEISSPDYGQALADARTATGSLNAQEKAYLREKDLFEHGAAAAKDVEAAEAAYVAAQAECDRAKSRLKLYGGAESETGEAFLLRSPISGVVVERTINAGQEVRSDQMLANAPNLFAPLFVVSDPKVLWLQLDVSESDLPLLQIGEKLQVHCRAFPERTFEGSVSKIGEELDPATRSVTVRGIVANPDRKLKAEMYVLADVVRDKSVLAHAGVEVSSKAIFTVDNRQYVFVELSTGKYQRTAVTIGTEKDGKVPIFEGIKPGQRVVTEGCLLLEAIVDPSN